MERYGEDLVIRTKLIVPRPRRYLLSRPALSARLQEALHYRLTVVQASTGYGKSTALVAALREAPQALFWYSITETDRDPLLFLLHLICAFRSHWPNFGQGPLTLLQETGSSTRPRAFQSVINAISNEIMLEPKHRGESVLVLDDYHLVNPAKRVNVIVDRLLQVLPPNLHLIISTRQRPALETLTQWRVKGDLLDITQQDLAFSAEEIEALFHTQYGLTLSEQQVQRLATETEGWVIALQMIWQGLQSGVAGSLDQILDELPRSLEDLFSYLGQEVLARQPSRIQDFLVRSSVLRYLHPAACDYLLGWEQSESLLEELDEENFFLVRMGEAYRYHHLFHDFLRQAAAADLDRTRALCRRAAEFFQQQGELEEAIYHSLLADEHATAAEMMVEASALLVQRGRLDTMGEWVTALPPSVLEQNPLLMYRMGELCRFASRFDEALAWYEQAQDRYRVQQDVAGVSRSLRGQAAVYLDTVRPLKAESLLQEALRLVDGQPDREEQARLLDLMAENMTNRGKWEEAKALRQRARELLEEGPGLADLDVRVLLRTGRLDQARTILEERVVEERLDPDRFREPRAHRETLLVLSLIYAFQGEAAAAFSYAQRGIQVGRKLSSPFVEAVGYMRLGHAWQVSDHPDAAEQALACYRRAVEIGEQLAVARTKVEALWGLCRLYGFGGDIQAAERHAYEGIEVGTRAGDEWIVALTGFTLGASYVLAGRAADADRWLTRSRIGFRDCGDPFGQALTSLWQCLLYQQSGSDQLVAELEELLPLVEEHDFIFLFSRLTFLGPPDPAILVPLLMTCKEESCFAGAGRMLEKVDLSPDLVFHPGYSLRVRTLGRFEVSRGRELVGDGEWVREKARQLLQLLLANREHFLLRDEIGVHLWPEASSTAAEQQFKVTLNALQQVLEPQRPARASTLFVKRRGNAYGLNPDAPIWLDCQVFEQLAMQAAAGDDPATALALYRQALSLYQGDFLPDCHYQDWCRQEQTRLRQLYLETATKAAEILLVQDDPAEAIELCQQMLTVDNCWEAAYQTLLRAYLELENHAQALRVFEQCVDTLRDELNVAPMPETLALAERISR